MPKRLIDIVLAASIAVGMAVPPSVNYIDSFNDKISITASVKRPEDLTTPQNKKVYSIFGDPVYIFFDAYDSDKIRKTRIYINDRLVWENQLKELRKTSCGVSNGWEIILSEYYFRLGENTMAYEIEDTKGNIKSESVTIEIEE